MLLLDASQGLRILKISSKRILEQTEVSAAPLRDVLASAGQVVFTDSRFNGIKIAPDGSLFVTTNNALTYSF